MSEDAMPTADVPDDWTYAVVRVDQLDAAPTAAPVVQGADELRSAEALAEKFHETYERLAPSFGYETRPDSAVAWADVPDKNRRLMVAVCAEILSGPLAQLLADAAAGREARATVRHGTASAERS